VFLAAIMITSVMAAGVAFSGSAAADHGDDGIIVVDDDFSETNETHKSSLEAAVSAATTGDTIRVRNGTYDRFSRVQVDDLTITAADGAEPVITVSSESELPNSNRIIDIGGSNVLFSGVDVEGPGRGTGVGVHLGVADGSSNINVSDVEITNVLTGIQTSTTTGAQIKNNNISTAAVGISLQADSATVTGNSISDIETAPAEGMGVLGTDHTIEDNDVDVTDDAVGIRFYNSEVPDINSDSGNEASVANTVLDSNQISSVEFSQSSNLYDGSVTIGSDSYPTIQAAIDAASEGDTIEIKPGQYEEVADNRDAYGTDNQPYSFGLYVGTDDLTIQGVTTAGEPITESENVQAEVISQASSSFGTNGVFVAADGVTIEGLEITPNPDASPNKNIEVAGNDFTLANSVVNGKIGSVYFNTGNVQKLSVVGNDINGSLSFNDGAGNETTADNRIVRNNHIGLLSFAGEQEDVAWRNYAVGPVKVEDNTIEGHQYTLRYEENGETKTYVYQGVLTRVGTITEPMDWQSVLADNTVERGVLIPDQSTPTGVQNVGETGSRYEVYYGVQDAIDDAENGDSVVTLPATYDESVTIDTPNVTVDGEGHSVIDGRIDIRTDEVTVRDLTVRNGAPSGSSEVEGIFIGNSNGFSDTSEDITIRNVTVEDIHPHGTAKTVEGIHVKHYDDSEPVDGVVMDNVTIRNVTGPSGAEVGGANGVKLQAGISNVSIEDSTIDDVEGRWSYGVVATPSSDEPGVPANVGIARTTISNVTATEYSGVGVGIDGSDNYGFADPTEVGVIQNDFADNEIDILNKNASGALEAPLNYYGDSSTPVISGNVVYDPVLTVPYKQTSDDVQDIRNYGSYLELDTEGEPAVIGFPAPPAEPLGELISNETLQLEGDGEGAQIFLYDNAEQSFEQADASTVPEAGDVIVITTGGDPISGEFVVPVDTAVEDNAATPSDVEINEGWNLVATGAANSLDDPTATSLVETAGQFQTQPTQPGAPPATVGAYDGTWLFVEDDGVLFPGYVEDQPPTGYFDLVLHPDTENDDDDN